MVCTYTKSQIHRHAQTMCETTTMTKRRIKAFVIKEQTQKSL